MRAFIVLLSLLAPALAPAVIRSANEQGQVLILPYYRVQSSPRNDNLQALLTLTNQTDQTKALKLRFRESVNGRETLSFNLYLSARDSWTGAIAALSAEAPAQLFTNDPSCTVPAITQVLPSGFRQRSFALADFTGLRADSGPQDAARTHEGYVEVIEMGTFVPGSPTDLELRRPAEQRACGPLLANWEAGGKWVLDPLAELAPPGGGLSGNLALVDIARTSVYLIPAVAIDGFSVVAQHTGPLSASPDLASAVTDPERRFVSSTVLLGGQVVRSQWPQNRAIDAVSAVLAVDSVAADYSLDPGIEARADWVLSLPTKRHYTDPSLSAVVQAPFDDSAGAGRCSIGIDGRSYDRDGEFDQIDYSPPPAPTRICRSVELVTLGFQLPSVLPAGPRLHLPYAVYSRTGSLQLGFPATGYQRTLHLSRPANGGERYAGLPVLAVRIQKFFNANSLPGVAGHFGSAQLLHGRSQCFRSVELIVDREFRTTPCTAD